jgi:hypothetical protein
MQELLPFFPFIILSLISLTAIVTILRHGINSPTWANASFWLILGFFSYEIFRPTAPTALSLLEEPAVAASSVQAAAMKQPRIADLQLNEKAYTSSSALVRDLHDGRLFLDSTSPIAHVPTPTLTVQVTRTPNGFTVSQDSLFRHQQHESLVNPIPTVLVP